ncbi:hypothetical protein [Hymenobacter negativus]|uniref:Uncharacterized protein n=1 Tax=Hymenobacter negativus TaxID=2795026 RepID=A0ABS3QEH1_9BACT|nr:hypothetical protein [Hymenobacter negativus]MBO2009408.1 hypothetical protein [Hymenobacter negativus]
MSKQITKILRVSLFLFLPGIALAQHQKPELPYNASLVTLQPEAGTGNPAFQPSATIRGMKALSDGKVYLVSTDDKSLSAYQGNRLVWKANVVEACPTIVGQHKIRKVTLSPKTLFVVVGTRTFAEVDAATGKIVVADVQRN